MSLQLFQLPCLGPLGCLGLGLILVLDKIHGLKIKPNTEERGPKKLLENRPKSELYITTERDGINR